MYGTTFHFVQKCYFIWKHTTYYKYNIILNSFENFKKIMINNANGNLVEHRAGSIFSGPQIHEMVSVMGTELVYIHGITLATSMAVKENVVVKIVCQVTLEAGVIQTATVYRKMIT